VSSEGGPLRPRSTVDQEPENQLRELRRYIQARGWTAVEYTDKGVSGAKDRRPALDQLLTDAKRRQFDVVVCWRLDRLAVGKFTGLFSLGAHAVRDRGVGGSNPLAPTN
jgi:DNA invertase Pin-like site-specific DNA recombinase